MAAAKRSQGKEYIVIDTEAHPDEDELETLAAGCDLLILPTSADALAIDALLQTVDNLQSLKNYSVLITMVDSRKRSTAKQARAALEKLEIPVFKQEIRRLSAHEKAALVGVPVFEAKDKFARIAWSEYQSLEKEVESHA
jgi:chromosome partitioning protein